MNEISFDLETLSLDRDAVILSIGAVRFSRDTGEIGPEFYRVIALAGEGTIGKINAGTVQWWLNQSLEAQQAIFGADVERTVLSVALQEFVSFCDGAEWYWQRGSKDAEWLEAAFARFNLATPWRYWQVCDQRTVTNLFPGPDLGPDAGVAHNALDDARRQAMQLCGVFSELRACGALEFAYVSP